MRNVPVAHIEEDLSGDFDAACITEAVKKTLTRMDIEDGQQTIALAFKWAGDPLHSRLFALAKGLCDGLPKTIAA